MSEEYTEYIESVLVSMADLLEQLVESVNALSNAMESEKEKSLGFSPKVSASRDSSKFSVPKLDYGEGVNVDDVQKSNSENLVAGILSGDIKVGAVGKAIREIL